MGYQALRGPTFCGCFSLSYGHNQTEHSRRNELQKPSFCQGSRSYRLCPKASKRERGFLFIYLTFQLYVNFRQRLMYTCSACTLLTT